MSFNYCEEDASSTLSLYSYYHNLSINDKIKDLYEKMDLCDDMQMREHLARKIVRLKRGMSIV